MICSVKVRLAALKVVEEYSTRLGEDFMVLLPETVPFLAELMEGNLHVFFLINMCKKM